MDQGMTVKRKRRHARKHPIIVINLHRPEPVRFTDFAVDNDLILVINEVGTKPDEPEQFVAGFDDTVATYMNMLVSVYGKGDTPDKAVADYRRKINGHTLVHRPGSSVLRRELPCPKTWREDMN